MKSVSKNRHDLRWTPADSMLDQRSTLEQKVGRQRTSGGITLAEQIERFPQLANAPRAGSSSSGASARSMITRGIHFQPLGSTIRHVRCVRCGQWGHQVGDRECGMRSGMLNANDRANLRREDPMPDSMMLSLGHSKANAKAKEADCATHAIGADGAVTASVQGSGNGEGGTETEEGRISPSAEAEFIASLSRKDRKLLLRHLSTMPGTGTGVGDCSGEYESKRKRKRRTHEHRRKHKRKKSKSRETNLEKSSNAEADQGGSNTTCTD